MSNRKHLTPVMLPKGAAPVALPKGADIAHLPTWNEKAEGGRAACFFLPPGAREGDDFRTTTIWHNRLRSYGIRRGYLVISWETEDVRDSDLAFVLRDGCAYLGVIRLTDQCYFHLDTYPDVIFQHGIASIAGRVVAVQDGGDCREGRAKTITTKKPLRPMYETARIYQFARKAG